MKKVTLTFIVDDEVASDVQNELGWGEMGNAATILNEKCNESDYYIQEAYVCNREFEELTLKEVEELRDSYCKIVTDAEYTFWDDKCKLLTIYYKIANCIEELKKYKKYISNRTYVEYCIKNLIRRKQ